MSKAVSLFLSMLILIPAVVAAQVSQQGWPGYRGPNDNGHAGSARIPVEWSETRNVVWKTIIPGRGWSSPVIMEGKIWLTTSEPDGKKLRAIAVREKDGQILFNIDLFDIEFPQEHHSLNSFASPSPVLEPGRVYVHFGTYGTACLDTKSGKVIWKRKDLQCDHGVGPGSSPMLYKNLLILTFDGQDLQYVTALDKNTGKTVWSAPRGIDFSGFAPDTRKAFTTPVVVQVAGQDQLISAGPHVVMAYEPLSGRELWRVRYEGFSASARPVSGDGLLYLNTGFSLSSVLAVKLEGSGDKTEKGIAWMNKRNLAARSSPLLIDGLLYMVNTAGQAKCLDPKTGSEIWSERVGGETSASPLYAGGNIYTFDESGTVTVFKPGRTFMKVAQNTLPEGCMASPAVIGSSLYVRTKGALYKICE